MSAAERFFDTNVLFYLLSADDARADRAEEELGQGGTLSVQVLNEFASVASRKLGMSFAEIRETLAAVRALCKIVPISEETHDVGLQLAERYGLAVYDAMIVAAALLAGCKTILSEDMQGGQILEGRLQIRNPFLAPAPPSNGA
jgi:predicted nucleic acid-binding protein